MIEAEVHASLRAFLREHPEPSWGHHLTMARLIARALRIDKSALIQTGTSIGYGAPYRLSYLLPLFIWPGPAILVVPTSLQERLTRVELPRLQQWIPHPKPVQIGETWPDAHYAGLLITTPEAWFNDRLAETRCLPDAIPTVIDCADDLEVWARAAMTQYLSPPAWDTLALACPQLRDRLLDIRIALTHDLFNRPPNPYECYWIEPTQRQAIAQLLQAQLGPLPEPWPQAQTALLDAQTLMWATLDRANGTFTLHSVPANLAPHLSPLWALQPLVIIGSALDLEVEAPVYRQTLGLEDMTCLKFTPDRQEALVQLYQPDGIPMPNTPEFQPALLREVRYLVSQCNTGFAVILVGDTPLKAQLAATLAAEFGTRVQVEKLMSDPQGILVTSWEFWRTHHPQLPIPQVMVITTLPIPSLEHPVVSGRVNYYKQAHQDWFRLYLLPAALMELQRSIAPVREAQGVIALLDSRVIHRSYGAQVLAALSPFARIAYLDDMFLPSARSWPF